MATSQLTHLMHTQGPTAATPVPCAALGGNARAWGEMAKAPKQAPSAGNGSSRAGHSRDAALELSSGKGAGASRAGCQCGRLAAPQHRPHFWGCRRAQPHTAAPSLCCPWVPAVRCSGAPHGSGAEQRRAEPRTKESVRSAPGRALRSGLSFVPRGRRAELEAGPVRLQQSAAPRPPHRPLSPGPPRVRTKARVGMRWVLKSP